MQFVDWEAVVKNENRRLENANRRFRYHNNSFENMTEELIMQKSSEYLRLQEPEYKESYTSFEDEINDIRLRTALSQLSEKQKRIIWLTFWAEMNRNDAAKALGCKHNTASELLSRALSRLEHLLCKL